MSEKTEMTESNDKENLEKCKKFKVPQYLIDAKKNAIKDCRMLYCGIRKPMTQSLMCFGWDCGDGWNMNIAELSYRLETMNLLMYPKYRTRIEAVQIKEKFGYFRGYFNVMVDQSAIRGFLLKIFNAPYRFLSKKVNYGYERVVDAPRHTTEEWDEISKEDFDKKFAPDYVLNEFGWKFEERDGKYYRNSCVHHPERSHSRPTRHLFLHWLMNLSWKFSCMMDFFISKDASKEQEVVASFMNFFMDKCVEETEKKCHDTCEYCGSQIGYRYSGRCETRGWIQYICEDCAKSHNLEYFNQKGDLCNPDGTIKMDKKEVERIRRKGFDSETEDFDDGCKEESDE